MEFIEMAFFSYRFFAEGINTEAFNWCALMLPQKFYLILFTHNLCDNW